MSDAHANLLSVQRNIILGLLLALAAGAWGALAWQSAGAHTDMTMTSSAMGTHAPLFLAIWVIMMVAMMFPAAAPMIVTYHKVQAGKRQPGNAFASTWVFVAAYLLVWTLAGAAAYGGVLAAKVIAARVAISAATVARIGGIVLVTAGIYQLTPLKDLCLSKCRTPVTFIMTSWRDGIAGALRMGLLHGAYCLGCCWLLFLILFPLGIMNIGAMAAVTVIIFAEKTLPWPRIAPYAAAFALVLYGGLVIAWPQLLPTFQEDGSAAMAAEMQMRMPPGEGYRWQILLLVAIVSAQSVLLTALLFERRRRMNAEVLAAIIAHELSQPLGAILTNSEAANALLKGSAPDLAELREILTDIQRDDRRASEVIRRMRSVLKEVRFERRDNDLNEIVRETIDLLSGFASLRKVDVSSEIVSGELRFKGDRVQIQQAIINLIGNALDAVSAVPHAKGKITIHTTRVEGFAKLAVSDTGPGISIDKAEIVFQPFFTTKPQGLGMGLAIARTIIEAHGGRIWTNNQIGSGAVFHIILPLSNGVL